MNKMINNMLIFMKQNKIYPKNSKTKNNMKIKRTRT